MISNFRSLPILLRLGLLGLILFLSVSIGGYLLYGLVPPITLAERLQAPSWHHFFGTDAFGRDVLKEVVIAAACSSLIVFPAVGLGFIIGVPIGLIAAVRRDGLGEMLMQASDILFAFPALIAALLLQLLCGSGGQNVMLAIAVYAIPVFARVACNHGTSIASFDFIAAAQLSGKGRIAIAFQHIFPNITVPLLTQASSQCGFAFIAEAALSYIGIGIQPPVPSLGRMLLEAQNLLNIAPWLAIWPGIMLFWIISSCQMIGEGLIRYQAQNRL
ncbi:MAG: ABC transporter permease [Zymomonas mobilis]|uniref:Peptide/nickel transport system permease protein n=1 Tax=Zymomonas mobilis TaxID=542 RepID=A0A542W1E1_ZYMMB|nr:ABC transporter permease [Zymomonas mobilis]TQL17386.1 peptide/nickel transport system permease protein [Zymomonas mobilis]